MCVRWEAPFGFEGLSSDQREWLRMKRLIQVLLAVLVCVSAVPAQRKSTRERDGLKGAVHTVRLESFVISKTTGKEEPLYGWIYTYDRDGYKTEADDFIKDGSLTRQIFYTYDEMNR
jgi:hypothetical protein